MKNESLSGVSLPEATLLEVSLPTVPTSTPEEMLKQKLFDTYLSLRDMMSQERDIENQRDAISRRPLRNIIRKFFHLLEKKEVFQAYQKCYDKLRRAVLWLREVVYTKSITRIHEGRKKQFYYVSIAALEPVCDRLGELLV